MHIPRRIPLVWVLAGLVAAGPLARNAHAGVYFLPATADTWVNEAAPTAIGGADSSLYSVRFIPFSRIAFLRFDLSGIPPGSVIQSAALTVDVTIADGSGAPINVHRATAPWTEAGATWDSLATAWDSLTVDGQLFAAGAGITGADVTALVQQWVDGAVPNNGLALVSTSIGNLTEYASRESTTGATPTLVVQTGTPAAGMQVATGWYTGSSTANRSITGVGFSPDVVIIKGAGGSPAWIRTSTMGGNDSRPLGMAAGVTTGRIRSLDADGFTVMNNVEVNEFGTRYDWIALRASAGEMVVSAYSGDGSAGRIVGGLGFTPAYVMILGEATVEAVQRFDTQLPGESHTFAASGPLTGAITAFTADGFVVDPAPETNASTAGKYHFVAFSSGANVATGSYSGTGTAPVSISSAGFSPDLVFIKSQTALGAAVFRSSSWSNSVAGPLGPGFYFGNGITSMLPSGFELGSAVETNGFGEPYYWLALAGSNVQPIPLEADVAVAIAVDDSVPVPGQAITFTLAAANAGPDSTFGLQVQVALPAGLTYLGHVLTHGTYSSASGIWDIGALGAGEVAGMDLGAQVDLPSAGATIETIARVGASAVSDTNVANNADTVAVTVQIPIVVDDTPGSLYPEAGYPGEPSLALRIGLDNASVTDLYLDTTTTVSLTDGTVSYSAPLANPTLVPSGASGFVIAFAPAAVPATLRGDTTYPLILNLRGTASGGIPLTQPVNTAGTNELFVPVPSVEVAAGITGNAIVSPGDTNVTLLSLAFANNTFSQRVLDTLVVTNASAGAGSATELDALASRLFLYADADTSGTRTPADTLLATTVFKAGEAVFATAASWGLPAGATGNLLVCASVDSFAARDGDVLDAVIARAADIRFTPPTPIAGSITPLSPIDSWGAATIDGFLSFQVAVAAASNTIYSGQTGHLLATIDVPSNGYAPDVLRALELSDAGGTFDPADFTAVRLHVDDGDGVFSPAGDPVLGTFAWSGDRYVVSGLALPVPSARRVFVAADAALTPTTGNRLVPSLPADGVTMASSNDGPIDTSVTPGGGITVVMLEQVEVTPVAVSTAAVHPGERDAPLLALSVRNGTLAPVRGRLCSLQKGRRFQ